MAMCMYTGVCAAMRVFVIYDYVCMPLVKQIAFEITRPEIEKVVLEGVLECRSGVLTFFNSKIKPKRYGKTPSWTTFDFGPGKLKRKLLQQN